MENESETESSSSESDGEETTPPTASPELSEISKLLLKAKQAAEVGVVCGRGLASKYMLGNYTCSTSLCIVFDITFSNCPYYRRMLKLKTRGRLGKNL